MNKIFNPPLKANLMDSLQYLTEINVSLKGLKEGKATQQEFIDFLLRRSQEFGYIADYKHSRKLMEQVNDVFTETKENTGCEHHPESCYYISLTSQTFCADCGKFLEEGIETKSV